MWEMLSKNVVASDEATDDRSVVASDEATGDQSVVALDQEIVEQNGALSRIKHKDSSGIDCFTICEH
jgi:hypothetical protein